MSLINSVHTNMGAMIALESLNKTNTQLAATQKQVSTGYRVADATDDARRMPWRSRSAPPWVR